MRRIDHRSGGKPMEQMLIKNFKIEDKPSVKYILTEGTRIAYMGEKRPEAKISPGSEYDLGGKLLFPGFINVHTHLDKSRLAERIKNESGTIGEARARLLAYKKQMTKADIKERARQTAEEMIQAGCIAVRSHVDVDPAIGLRGVEALLELREEYRDKITIQIVAFPQEGISEAPGTSQLMEQALAMGADVVGGHLSIAADFYEHSARVFELAEKYDRDVDIHVDYDIDRDYSKKSVHRDGVIYPDELGITAMCEVKKERGFAGRTAASHLCGLDAADPEAAQNLISLIRRSGIDVVALAPNNMYCNGRGDAYNVRRGVTKVKALMGAGVRVSFGPDNIKDPFNPLGSADIIQNAVLTAYACHFASEEDYRKLFTMCTRDAADIMGLEDYGLEEGREANFTVVDAENSRDALADKAAVKGLFRRGRPVFLR